MEATQINTEKVLQNLQKFLSDIKSDKETQALVNGYIKSKDVNKQKQIINYLSEKYNLDENIVNTYFNSLKEKAEKRLSEIDELDKINEKLFKNLNYKSNPKFSAMQVLFPFILLKNVAETYSIAGNIWANEFKKLALKHINEKTLKGETNTYLKKIEALLKEEKTEEIEKESLKELTLLPEEEQNILIGNVTDEKKAIDSEIKQEVSEVMLLTHKITEKDVNLTELEMFENTVAKELSASEQAGYNQLQTKINVCSAGVTSSLNPNVRFNLMKEIFPDLTQAEFAKIETLGTAVMNYDLGMDLSKITNESQFNKMFNSFISENPKYNELYQNIKKELYGMDISDISPKRKDKGGISR